MTIPKNYSRKSNICTCECPVFSRDKIQDDELLDKVIIKYEVEPTKHLNYNKEEKKKNIRIRREFYWGTYKKILELPKIFDSFNESEYKINISYFTRDDVKMPYVASIRIINCEKYKMLKLKEDRKKKLSRITNTVS